MTKYYMITDMSQLSLIKEHILQRGIDLKDLNGSYLYDTLFNPSSYLNQSGFIKLSGLLRENNYRLFFDYINGSYCDSLYGEDAEVVRFDTGRYKL